MPTSENRSQTEDTRQKLLKAGVSVFAQLGFNAASTRQLASQAGVNLAAIPYHFKSKQGLYLAVAAYVADEIARLALPADSAVVPDDPDAAIEALNTMLTRMLMLVAGEPEAADWAGFILREQAQPTEAFDILYERAMGKVTGGLAALLGVATGVDPDDPRNRLRALTLLGQVLVFRTSRAGVMRTMGWSGYNPDHLHLIADTVTAQASAIIKGVIADAR